MPYVGMLRQNGSSFTFIKRFDGDIPGWGGLAKNDKLFVGDCSGGGKADLFIFNGDDWGMAYVGMFASTGSSLQMTARDDGDIPGSGGLARHDQLYVGDFNGDGKSAIRHKFQRRRLEHALPGDVCFDRNGIANGTSL